MAPSNVCNCIGKMIHFSFTAKSKLSVSLTLFILPLALAQLDNPPDSLSYRCGNNDILNATALSMNLNVVLNLLVQNVNKTGYNISWYGENEDKVYGLAQCRGDLNASACRECVSYANEALSYLCPGSAGYRFGSIYLSGCFLRYDTHNFYSKLNFSGETLGGFVICDSTQINYTVVGVEDAGSLDWAISNVLTRVMEKAVSSNIGYSTLSENGLYSLAQCWRDLNKDQCNECLNNIYNSLGLCPTGTNERGVEHDNCMIGLSTHTFYSDGVPLLSPPSTSQTRRTDQGKDRPIMLGLGIGGAVVALVLVGVAILWKRNAINAPYLSEFDFLSPY